MPALSIEREALWKRVGEAGFLTNDEKRAATGYEPLPAQSLTTLLAKYSPDQPRVPAGNPDGGHAANADEGRVLSDANPDEFVPGAQYAQNTVGVYIATKDPRVQRATFELGKALALAHDIVDQRGEDLSGQDYGIKVHAEFARIVAERNILGVAFVDIERTFGMDGNARYGSKHSVRPDIVMRDEAGEIIAIYDVKTRGARLDSKRADRLRYMTKSRPNTPVFEIRIDGLRVKSLSRN